MEAAAHHVEDHCVIFGHRLRAIRGGLGLTQVEFAARAGFSQTRLSALERGEGWVNLAGIWEKLVLAGAEPLLLFVPDLHDPRVAEILDRLGQLDSSQIDVILAMTRSLTQT